MSENQKAIMNFIGEHGSITVAEAVPLIGGNLYANANFHVGNTLRRMVERGWLVRVSRGKYSLPHFSPVPERVKQNAELGELFSS